MGYPQTAREFAAAQKRQEREARRRQKELERQAKEEAKLTAIDLARFEVSTYENQLEVLVSVHREQGPVWDWRAVASSLRGPSPGRGSFNEVKAKIRCCGLAEDQLEAMETAIAGARYKDEQDHLQALQTFEEEANRKEELKALALRILAGEPKAYIEALVELSPLGELSELGSEIHFAVQNPQIVECELHVNRTKVIPKEVKSLTAAEKLSVKAMSKVRFHELYQDYVCSCTLRVAREVFAMLPVRFVMITAHVPQDGCSKVVPVLSLAAERTSIEILDFERDPSDLIDGLRHRSDFKASRRAGAFAPITPLLAPEAFPLPEPVVTRSEVLNQVRRMREELRAENTQLQSLAEATSL